ncbi:unnamed protein product [Phytophthora fragariaefolia]|uniref:Unnamed protein product n=1 Tax=Phytophthora fragariaefolia TaxID=1490495 RepID=A0A9W7D227_9STRA|nr:unnamed protein product [Phytophthora fragariaefolia]
MTVLPHNGSLTAAPGACPRPTKRSHTACEDRKVARVLGGWDADDKPAIIDIAHYTGTTWPLTDTSSPIMFRFESTTVERKRQGTQCSDSVPHLILSVAERAGVNCTNRDKSGGVFGSG